MPIFVFRRGRIWILGRGNPIEMYSREAARISIREDFAGFEGLGIVEISEMQW